MSDQSLREALESVAGLMASGRAPYLDEEFVCDLLRLHPAEPAPVVTDDAVEAAARSQYEEFSARVSWGDLPDTVKDKWRLDSRRALEAAAPLLGPRPLLDREAVHKAIAENVRVASDDDGFPVPEIIEAVPSVMGLARPMPTQEQLAEALVAHMRDWHEDGSVTCKACGYVDDQSYGWPRHQADVVLALLNGAES